VGDHPRVLDHLLAPLLPGPAAVLGVPRTLPPGARGVALTFDDGPHPEGTPAVLDALAREGVKATFFLVGEQVERRPDLAAEIAAHGHAVAVHGYRHRLQLRMRGREVEADIERAIRTIMGASGVEPLHHRPPYGIYSPRGLQAARAGGLKPLLWSRWGKDWRKFTTASRIARRVTHDVRAGDVILLHDADFYNSRGSHLRTLEALKPIIRELKSRGLDTVLPI
jgi:peptidoglycan/xylan/chitin deacetylase (PgdA/CDA1 family)